jgi:hypothetical protein
MARVVLLKCKLSHPNVVLSNAKSNVDLAIEIEVKID